MTSNPSPLSLGPPQCHFPQSLAATQNSPAASIVPSSPPEALQAWYTESALITPPVISKINALSEFLKARSPDDPQRVIAVDGLDRNAVQLVIAELHYDLSRDLRCTVRVLSEELPPYPLDESAQLAHFLRQIRQWAAMWNLILQAPPPEARLQTPPDHPQQASEYSPERSAWPCIWIMPLSPLMATIRASTGMALRGAYGSIDLWPWLASHWAGHLRPDVTINVQEVADTSWKWEVLRFEESDMNTLIVTTSSDRGVHVTSGQLRFIVLEVREWVYNH